MNTTISEYDIFSELQLSDAQQQFQNFYTCRLLTCAMIWPNKPNSWYLSIPSVKCKPKIEIECFSVCAGVRSSSNWTNTATHCNTLHHAASHCNTLQHTALHCSTLQHTAAHCSTMQHTAAHCSTLQHTAAYCSTLQHTAAHCSTLQHTATYWHTFCVAAATGHAGTATKTECPRKASTLRVIYSRGWSQGTYIDIQICIYTYPIIYMCMCICIHI